MKYIKHILSETIFLLPYLLMAVSFLSVLFGWIGWNFDKNFWCNLGGYSFFTNIMFVYILTLNKNYCFTTRALPVSMMFVSFVNMFASFFPGRFKMYEQFFEVIILSITLFVSLIVFLTKRTFK